MEHRRDGEDKVEVLKEELEDAEIKRLLEGSGASQLTKGGPEPTTAPVQIPKIQPLKESTTIEASLPPNQELFMQEEMAKGLESVPDQVPAKPPDDPDFSKAPDITPSIPSSPLCLATPPGNREGWK